MGRHHGGFWVGGCGWLLGALVTGCGSGPALRYEEFYSSDGVERSVGTGCIVAEEGLSGSSTTGAAGGAANPVQTYTVAYDGEDEEAITVTVIDGGGTVRASRVYDEAFLESGKSDEIVVDLEMDTLRLRYFGSDTCDTGE